MKYLSKEHKISMAIWVIAVRFSALQFLCGIACNAVLFSRNDAMKNARNDAMTCTELSLVLNQVVVIVEVKTQNAVRFATLRFLCGIAWNAVLFSRKDAMKTARNDAMTCIELSLVLSEVEVEAQVVVEVAERIANYGT